MAALHALACTPAEPPPQRSFALPPPELTEPAFEPHLSIDPDDPDRIVVAAHYGIGYNRGGRKIWTWQSDDGGRRWTAAEMPLPAANAALAADAVTAFGTDGRPLLAFLFADTTGREFAGGLALARGHRDSPGFGPATVVARGGLGSPAAAAVDKGWLAVDRGRTSPHRGAVYLTWHLNRPDLMAGTVRSSLWFAASRDGGETFTDAMHLADAGHGQVAVRSNGTVDVLYGPAVGSALFHATSVDGGRTFAPPDTVVQFGDSVTVDVPHLIGTTGGSLLACWSQATRSAPTRYIARCARSHGGGRWEAPTDVVPDLPPESSVGFPVTASAGGAVWLLAYRADQDTTRVLLLRSTDGGRTFPTAWELASLPIGRDRFCIAAGAPCRRAADAFFPGDYFGLSAMPRRVAAAYVLPANVGGEGRATVFVSVVHPGS